MPRGLAVCVRPLAERLADQRFVICLLTVTPITGLAGGRLRSAGASKHSVGAAAVPPEPSALLPWMHEHIPGFRGPLAVQSLTGGQSNPTFKLTAVSGSYVLRRKPFGNLLPSAHAVEREYRVIRALQGSAVPVPAVHGLCEDSTVVGSPFYVMDFVPGRIFWNQLLPGVPRLERAQLFDAMNGTIAALHAIDPAACGLEDFGRPTGYLERQIARWTKQYHASVLEPVEEMDRLAEWLGRNLPQEVGGRIVHGDFKIDNLIFHSTEPRVVAVLDWELSTIGDALADFAFHAMAWRLAPDLFRGWAGLDLRALGIPSESEYVREYARRLGRPDVPHWRFYLVFSMFRLAAILLGIAKRADNGTAADRDAAAVGSKGRPVAQAAWRLAKSTDP